MLADAIDKLLQDSELSKAYKEKVVRRAGEFSTEKYVKAFVDLAENR